MLLLFQCITGDGWSAFMLDGSGSEWPDSQQPTWPAAAPYAPRVLGAALWARDEIHPPHIYRRGAVAVLPAHSR